MRRKCSTDLVLSKNSPMMRKFVNVYYDDVIRVNLNNLRENLTQTHRFRRTCSGLSGSWWSNNSECLWKITIRISMKFYFDFPSPHQMFAQLTLIRVESIPEIVTSSECCRFCHKESADWLLNKADPRRPANFLDHLTGDLISTCVFLLLQLPTFAHSHSAGPRRFGPIRWKNAWKILTLFSNAKLLSQFSPRVVVVCEGTARSEKIYPIIGKS